MRTICIISSFLWCVSVSAQDTLKNYFGESIYQVESWYVVTDYQGSSINNGDFIEYYSNGEIKESGSYSMGQLHGKNYLYSENGEIAMTSRYTNGILNGEYKVYYPSGNLKERRLYINGVLEGDYKYYKDEKDVIPYLVEKYTKGIQK